MNKNRRIIGVLVILAILITGFLLMFQVERADAATVTDRVEGTQIFKDTAHYTFYTSDYDQYLRLKSKPNLQRLNVSIKYNGTLPSEPVTTSFTGTQTFKESACYTYYVKDYNQYLKLKQKLGNFNVRIIFTGKIPTPAPTPAPEPKPVPTPVPQPEPTPVPAPVNGLTADEQKMVDLINQERITAGLKPLQVDMRLVNSARIKSQDMIDNNYFAHTSPSGVTPWDLMKAQGVTYRTAGENLAGNLTVEAAHKALMSSEGHRANILNPNFTHIGIGIVQGGKYGAMFTQHFIGV